MSGDDYVQVAGTIVGITPKAVLLDVATEEVWIPRSLLHGADDLALKESLGKGDTHVFQVREWFAKKEGLD